MGRQGRLQQTIRSLVSGAFSAAVMKGYENADGIVMQCNTTDYHMMEEGLATVLSVPTAQGGAEGDTNFIVTVRDKDNTGHDMTIADAQVLADEMRGYYWQLWQRKGVYRDALLGCATVEEMKALLF